MLKLSHLKRSFVISAVVGTVLTLTNQYEALMGDQSLNMVKALITYAIPFFVSLLSALMEKKRMMQDISMSEQCSPAPLETVRDDLASISLLSDQVHAAAINVNATLKSQLEFVREFSQLNGLDASLIDKVIEDAEAAIAGSTKNLGAGDELKNLSSKVHGEIECLLAEG